MGINKFKYLFVFALSGTCWVACEGAGEWRESLLRSEEKLRLRPEGKPRPANTLLLFPAVKQAKLQSFLNSNRLNLLKETFSVLKEVRNPAEELDFMTITRINKDSENNCVTTNITIFVPFT